MKLFGLIAIVFGLNHVAYAQDLKCKYSNRNETSVRKEFNLNRGEHLEFPIDSKKSRVIRYETNQDLPEGMQDVVSIFDLDRSRMNALKENRLKGEDRGMYLWLLGNISEKGAVIYQFTGTADGKRNEISLICEF